MTEDYKVRHTSAETIEELEKFRNSKYVQSRVGNVFQQVKCELKKGRMVCFSGTPCQVEGLRRFLDKDDENLILVDVVCRAVPSPGVWEKYVQYEVEQKGELSSIRFRDKTLGYQYSTMELKTKDGKTYRGGIENQPWLRMFFSGMIIRPSCSDCKFRSRYRNSDFTIWDCFSSYRFDKSFDERKGTTRVLVHSEKGRDVLRQIDSYYQIKRTDANTLVSNVDELQYSPSFSNNHEAFIVDFNKNGFEKTYKKFFHTNLKLVIRKSLRILCNKCGVDILLRRYIKIK